MQIQIIIVQYNNNKGIPGIHLSTTFRADSKI